MPFPTVFASSFHTSPPVIPWYHDSQPWLAGSAHRERHSSYLGAARIIHLPSCVLVVQDEPSKTSWGSHKIGHGVCGFAHLNGNAGARRDAELVVASGCKAWYGCCCRAASFASCGCMHGLVVMLAHDGGSQAWSFAPSQEALGELSSTCSSDATHAAYGLFHSQTLAAALAYCIVREAQRLICVSMAATREGAGTSAFEKGAIKRRRYRRWGEEKSVLYC